MTLPITDIKIIEGSSTPAPQNYHKVPVNLNDGNKGKQLYVCFRRSQETPITDLYIIEGQNASPPAGWVKIDTDLNWGAGGKYLYLCYTKAKIQSPISDILTLIQPANHEKLPGIYGYDSLPYQIIPRDTNWGAGGSYVFIYYIRLKDQSDYFNNGIKSEMLQYADVEFESSRVQVEKDKMFIRTQRLTILERRYIAAELNFEYEVEYKVGTTESQAESIASEVGISMGGSFSVFSAEVNAKLGYTKTTTFTTMKEETRREKVSSEAKPYPRQFIYAQVEDILRVQSIKDNQTRSILVSGTKDKAWFISNAEGLLIKQETVE